MWCHLKGEKQGSFKQQLERRCENLEVFDLGVKKLDGGMKMFIVKLELKKECLNNHLGVNIPKLGKI